MPAAATTSFRSAIGKSGVLDKKMDRIDAYRMIRRRTAEAGFKLRLGCQVLRAELPRRTIAERTHG